MSDPDLVVKVATIRWRVPITEYVGAPGGVGYIATCRTCDEHGLEAAWSVPSTAAVNRWVAGHRQWHRDTPLPVEGGLW